MENNKHRIETIKTYQDLLDALLDGYTFGQYRNYGNGTDFYEAIYYSQDTTHGYTWIYYSHYGSSATRPTVEDLEWLITRIFKTTLEGFLEDYSCKAPRYGYIKRPINMPA